MSNGPRRSGTEDAPAEPGYGVELPAGTTVGEYQIVGLLGAGGMGRVYAAVHPVIGKHAAIKVLRAELSADPDVIERFVREARAVNQIGHPNIVDVFAFGALPDGRSYFAMEQLMGESLAARMDRAPLSLAEIRDIIGDITRALDAAHGKGIVHRDLKPDNVFLVEVPGERPRVKLLDFGIAKLTGQDRRVDLTRTGSMIGTPMYIAPEQARGLDVDHRVDVYSLGVMLFEMVAGSPPFHADNAMDMIAKHLTAAPPRPSAVVGVPAALDDLIVGMLAKDAADRPALARIREVIDDAARTPAAAAVVPARSSRSAAVTASAGLAATAGEPRGASGESPIVRRSRRAVAIAVAAVAVTVVVSFVVVRRIRDDRAAAPARGVMSASAVDASPGPTVIASAVDAAAVVAPTGTLIVTARRPGKPTITIDGSVDPHGLDQPIALAPGTHDVVVSVSGRKPLARTILIEAGKTVTIELPAPGGRQTQTQADPDALLEPGTPLRRR